MFPTRLTIPKLPLTFKQIASKVLDIPTMAQPQSSSSDIMSKTRPIQLVLDFDGTLTEKDTMHVLAEVGYERQRKYQRSPPPRPWHEIVDAYMSDFKVHSSNYVPKPTERRSLGDETAWLASLQSIEKTSADRAIKAGVFDNVHMADVNSTIRTAINSNKVQVRKGWSELITYVHQHNACIASGCPAGGSISILSVNWSAYFVKAVLKEGLRHESEHSTAMTKTWFEQMRVFANELPSLVDEGVWLGNPPTTPPASTKPMSIRTSQDKVEIMSTISVPDRSQKQDTSAENKALLIYVGDSTTDLGCLAAADMGICIRDEPIGSGQKDLAETCTRLGIEVIPLSDQAPNMKHEISSRPLFWSNSFDNILKWLKEYS